MIFSPSLTEGNMGKLIKKTIIYSSVLIFLLSLGTGVVFPQPKAKVEKGPEIRLGEVTFFVREFESTLSPLKMLEVHVEIFNRSQRSVAPPNSINVVVAPKEIKYPEGSSVAEFNPTQEEMTLTISLPPNTGRIFIIGLQLPEKKPESITFEVQINPPDGEKKTVKWEGS
jgi:hypothetical protein